MEQKKRGPKDKGLKRRVTFMLKEEEFNALKACCPNYKIGEFVRWCICHCIEEARVEQDMIEKA